jgi:cytoplasmic iron level regulating protein YaaA (DUF328/UPF0246 family)
VFILLPPSEAKVAGGDGAPVVLDGPLAATRRIVLAETAAVCAKAAAAKTPRGKSVAAAALKLPPGELAETCERNAEVLAAPTMPALDRYEGVVYQGLSAGSLKPAARKVADRSILIFSGAFGVVRGDELLPWYRIPASARLPKAGTVAALWRPALAGYLPSLLGDAFVVDLRSSDYAGLWKSPNVLTVRVLQRRPTGDGEQVVSFHSKLVKGRLARAIVQAPVENAAEVGEIAVELGLSVRATEVGLDLIDPDPTPFTARG